MGSKQLIWIKRHIMDLASVLCAAFMLCVLPLLFRNAFFDINRVKVNAVIRVIPVILLVFAFAYLVLSNREKPCVVGKPVFLIMAVFLSVCVVSCAMTGFEPTTLTGSEGRYCGLYFMLCCGAAFYMIAWGKASFLRWMVVPVMLCAAACSFLGVLNAMGIDPLGFYVRIQKGQEKLFLSTIGHFDFFGTYLVMIFPLAAGQFIFGKSRFVCAMGCICAAIIACGAMASRTDSAFAGLHLACFSLLVLSGGCFRRLSRALWIWAGVFLLLPVIYGMLRFSAFDLQFSGLPAILDRLHIGELGAALLGVSAWGCFVLERRGVQAPDQRRYAKVMLCAFSAAVFGALLAVLYFSIWDTTTDLGSAASFLRFNDRWGSLRGFAWIRSLRAFYDYEIHQKLFGAGMEQTLRILTPYFDDPSMLVYGVFNDPHCQPLQMLLTCGIVGMTAFVLFYVFMMALLMKHAEKDPLPCGVLSAVFSYSIIMMINVTQPILIATYFSLCGLGVACIREKDTTGGTVYES